MSTFTLTDAAIERALAPGLDVTPPTDLMDQIAAAIATQPRRSRSWLLNPAAWRRQVPLATPLFLLLLLLLVLLVGALVAGSLPRRAYPNGHVITVGSSGTTLLDVDPTTTNFAHTLLTLEGGIRGGESIFGVTRSLDGGLISFWTHTSDGTTLEIVDGNGGDRRRVATNLTPRPVGQGQIDVWAPDARSLAAGVQVDGTGRILVVDVSSGDGKLIGPPDAGNPLWSPDGNLLAFSYIREGRSVVAVMHPDGSGLRVVSGDLGIFNASGVNNWSPDGVWLYFGAERNSFATSHIYRAQVDAGISEQLTVDILSAAPALSPDGKTVAYSDWPGGRGTQNLMLMDADGTNQRRLLASTINDGWSNDGQFLLGEWRPAGADFELLVIRPDGTDRRTLLTFPGGCLSPCAQDLGWGQPRP